MLENPLKCPLQQVQRLVALSATPHHGVLQLFSSFIGLPQQHVYTIPFLKHRVLLLWFTCIAVAVIELRCFIFQFRASLLSICMLYSVDGTNGTATHMIEAATQSHNGSWHCFARTTSGCVSRGITELIGQSCVIFVVECHFRYRHCTRFS